MSNSQRNASASGNISDLDITIKVESNSTSSTTAPTQPLSSSTPTSSTSRTGLRSQPNQYLFSGYVKPPRVRKSSSTDSIPTHVSIVSATSGTIQSSEKPLTPVNSDNDEEEDD